MTSLDIVQDHAVDGMLEFMAETPLHKHSDIHSSSSQFLFTYIPIEAKLKHQPSDRMIFRYL